MSLSSEDRRKLIEELPYSWRSLSVQSFCYRRAELYWEAMRTGSKTDWVKYELLSKKFDKLHAPKKKGARRREQW